MTNKLFVIVFELQKPEITHYCFDTCKKVLIGSIMDIELGALIPCRETVCPFVEKEMPKPFGKSKGENIYLRKLQAVPKVSKP